MSGPSLEALQLQIGTWAERTFPEHTLGSHVAHLMEEVEELAQSTGTLLLAEEAADCLILLLSLAYFCGFSLTDAVIAKHGVNVRRHWGQPDERGVVHHAEQP